MRRRLGVEAVPSPFTPDWTELLGMGLDGVILADDFDAHAPRAVAFLEAGIHVLSETAACAGEEEGRQLVAAADDSRASYSFAENYVVLPHVHTIKETVATGSPSVRRLATQPRRWCRFELREPARPTVCWASGAADLPFSA